MGSANDHSYISSPCKEGALRIYSGRDHSVGPETGPFDYDPANTQYYAWQCQLYVDSLSLLLYVSRVNGEYCHPTSRVKSRTYTNHTQDY